MPWLLTHDLYPEDVGASDSWALPVKEPPAAMRANLETRGFQFLSAAEQAKRLPTIQQAELLVKRVPSLAASVCHEVRAAVLIAADESYDVSHSEPRWPGWIFLSCPVASDEMNALRVAESIVHEAMHLRLTNLEHEAPLIACRSAQLLSPWKGELRGLQGILHGLYVFNCISCFLNSVGTLTPAGTRYVQRRTTEIAAELHSIPTNKLRSGLTDTGSAFLDRLCNMAAERGRPCSAG